MKLYNTLSQSVQNFKPLSERKVNIYVCGITPYDTTHLGHAFTYVLFDGLIRFLRYMNYQVAYVQNVTDIDDDILKRAKQENKDWKQLGDLWTNKFLDDMKSLNVLSPTHYVKATDSIPRIIEIISYLLDNNYAYEHEGTIFFDVSKRNDYGKLSHFTKDQMILISKDRGADPNDPRKKQPLDFILWQKSLQSEPFWESPWGKGRPGWHIECSAMINQYLGDQIDIHGGGRDLVYPHHESEIAQSESFTKKNPYVSYWMHTAMLLYQGEKMSKSLKNLIMVSDLLQKYDADTIRFFLLSHHYRNPWEFTYGKLHEAKMTLESIKKELVLSETKNLIHPDLQKCLENDFNTQNAFLLIPQLLKNKKNYPGITKFLLVLGFHL